MKVNSADAERGERVVDLACLQGKEGHEVVLASLEPAHAVPLREHGVQHVLLGAERASEIAFQRFKRIAAIVQSFRPEVFHAHDVLGLVVGRAVRRKRTYRIVVSADGEPHSILHAFADRIITANDGVVSSMSKLGVPRRKLRVVRHGAIGGRRHHATEAITPMNLARPAILSIGDISRRNGSEDLIAAFLRIADEHPLLHLYLVGDGSSASLAGGKNNTGRIHVLPRSAEWHRYLRSADIFAAVPHREVMTPEVVSEARNAGCCIVATRVGQLPELLEFGDAGRLIAPRDPAALALEIDHLLRFPIEANLLRKRARVNLDRLHADRAGKETEQVYLEVLGRNRSEGAP